MKYTLYLSICFFLCGSASAQQHTIEDLTRFNDSIARTRNLTTRTAMITLGSWAVANIATGFIIAGKTTGEARYFWRMNGYWNFINLGLAGMGLLNVKKAFSRTFFFAENYEAQHRLEKIYIFNFGLDLAYIAGGFYLRERGMTATYIDKTSGDQLRGYGRSIVLQGGFLLLMDGVMFRLHQKNTLRMNKKLQQLDLNATPGGLGISYHF